MLESTLPIVIVTGIFGFIAIFGFFFVGRSSSDRGLVQTMVVTTAFCLWIFWLAAYMAQIHPLLAPILKVEEACVQDAMNNTICT
eukprot:m.17719 g.17719  ORF g.17719 m.17719 type:complete len:85 (+) comp8187_c1_seq1:123-377(+)